MDLSAFPVTRRWPPQHPDRIQLYTLDTTNGVKVSIALEELGLPYETHRVSFRAKEQKTPEFLSLNPNGRIPAIVDPQGPAGEPFGLSESGAILHYLADKTGRLLPDDPRRRWEAMQWLHWQMSAVGPMFGQVGWFFKNEGRIIEDKRPLQRYVEESRRLLLILDERLGAREWIMGEAYTIIDIAMVGPVWNFLTSYKAGDLVGFSGLANVNAWYARMTARPAVQRGLCVGAAPHA